MRAPPSWPNHLPKVHLQALSQWGEVSLWYVLKGHRRSCSSKHRDRISQTQAPAKVFSALPTQPLSPSLILLPNTTLIKVLYPKTPTNATAAILDNQFWCYFFHFYSQHLFLRTRKTRSEFFHSLLESCCNASVMKRRELREEPDWASCSLYSGQRPLREPRQLRAVRESSGQALFSTVQDRQELLPQ